MRRGRLVVAVGVAFVAGGLGAAVVNGVGDSERAASRRAADRDCERPYVVTPTTGLTRRPRLEPITDLDQPTSVAIDPTDPTHVLVGLREGRVVALDGVAGTDATVVLDLEDDTSDEGDAGLLGVAYEPDGDWLYVYRTRADRTERITAYPVRDGRPDASGERIVLDIPHPANEQHHGGALAFGPDGYLYVGVGDGGGLGDPRGNAQRLSVLMGKLLRIEPTPEAEEPYRIPPDNPYVGQDGRRPEVYAYGLRNPFRLSFDGSHLWVADVGQSCWEEVDVVDLADGGGWNFGWDRREGAHRFQGDPPPDDVSPLHEVSHREGWCAIVGGFVYRGQELPDLDGVYLFTDYCKGVVVGLERLPDGQVRVVTTGVRVERPVAVVAGPDGEPWVLSLDGDVDRLVPAG